MALVGKSCKQRAIILPILDECLCVNRNTSLGAGAPKGYNTLADCMLNQIQWHHANPEMNPLEYSDFARLIV